MNGQNNISANDSYRSRFGQGLSRLREFLGGFLFGSCYAAVSKEGEDQNDEFLLLCFGEALGLPLPTSYFTLELLPHLANELQGWERRMLNRRSILAEKAGQYEYCC